LNLVSGQIAQELRFNYSNVSVNVLSQALGALAPYTADVTRLSIEGVGQTIAGAAGQNRERQFTGNYGISGQVGRHQLRAGFNYSKLIVSNSAFDDSVLSIVSTGIDALLAGVPLGLTYSYGGFTDTTIQKYFVFAQDTLRVSDRLHLLLGLRWDVTPSSSGNHSIYAPAGSFNIG
jgi:outer membrane receptor protein involved in Fe transport